MRQTTTYHNTWYFTMTDIDYQVIDVSVKDSQRSNCMNLAIETSGLVLWKELQR